MRDDAYRTSSYAPCSEGPASPWAHAFARCRLLAHPAHIGPCGFGVLLCSHNVSWYWFLTVAIIAGLAGAVAYGAGSAEKSETAQHVGVALAVWAGIFGALGAIFGVSSSG